MDYVSAQESNLHPALSRQQAFALIAEAQSTQNLLRDCVTAIFQLREPTQDGDTVFTLGSIGVEKLMKVMLGCDSVKHSGQWPSREELKGWGHDIEALHARMAVIIRSAVSAATAPGYAATLVDFVERSTTLPLLFATLSRYGKSGRFHYLDIVATNKPNPLEPPLAYWERLETHITSSEPGFATVPHDDPALFYRYMTAVSERAAEELNNWWYCIHRLGVQGCFGALGTNMGWSIWPPDRPTPERFR